MKLLLIVLCIAALCAPTLAQVKSGGEALLASIERERLKAFAYTVVLDAGHGGEDGGAVAPDGTPEKDLNLSVAADIAAYFELFGVSYVPVRTTDIAVGDPSLPTVRERKSSDIRERYALVERTENAILLSIHQNKFPEARYSGTQVFYSPNDALSQQIAERIQYSVASALQPENRRETKASADGIYLLYRAVRPSVLVECGFLSNEAELNKLKEPAYRSALSYYIIKGFLFGCAEQP